MFRNTDSDKIAKPNITSYITADPLEGLNSGVPTRTTSTLTPTTMRNIENGDSFIEDQVESHQNQARFVPPLIQHSTPPIGIARTCGFVTVIDTKSWQGGSTKVTDYSQDLSSLSSPSPPLPTASTPPRKNVGGRRPIKDKSISPEEEERRAVRRERNKLAAARCRKRRLDKTNELLMETEGLQEKKLMLQNEIQALKSQREELQFILDNHHPCARMQETQSDSADDVKPFVSGSIKLETQIGELKKNGFMGNSSGKRPTTLSVPPAFPQHTVDGIPSMSTPSSGINFNFESLMDGGTGLTPVSAPLIPSCATQQRNSGCVDLSSPESGKLVSL